MSVAIDVTKPSAPRQPPVASSPRCSAAPRWTRPLLLIAIIGLLLTGGILLWNEVLKGYFIANNFDVVEPGRIYRSGQISRHLIRQTLTEKHIGLIVDLSKEDTADAKAEEQTAADLGVKRITLHLSGNGTGDPNLYAQAIKAIVEANKSNTPVLVHCQSGAQRTGGVIAAYRILVEGKSDADAFAEAQRYGRSNPKLIPFVEEHLPQWKQQLSDEHVLPAK